MPKMQAAVGNLVQNELKAANRVVVTGLSTITPLGTNLNQTWKGIMDGRSGVKNIKDLNPVFQSLKC